MVPNWAQVGGNMAFKYAQSTTNSVPEEEMYVNRWPTHVVVVAWVGGQGQSWIGAQILVSCKPNAQILVSFTVARAHNHIAMPPCKRMQLADVVDVCGEEVMHFTEHLDQGLVLGSLSKSLCKYWSDCSTLRRWMLHGCFYFVASVGAVLHPAKQLHRRTCVGQASGVTGG